MTALKIIGISLIGIIVVTIGYFALGGYNVAADEPHWALTSSTLTFIRDRSIATHSKDIEIPKDLGSTARIARGAGLYDEMCISCHLAPGLTDSELRKGLYPQPPALTSASNRPANQKFYIITHGFKMTAMPAWGKSHNPDQIWDMVAFLQKLPELTPEQYKTMTTETDSHGHNDHGHAKPQIKCGGD